MGKAAKEPRRWSLMSKDPKDPEGCRCAVESSSIAILERHNSFIWLAQHARKRLILSAEYNGMSRGKSLARLG